MTTQKPEWVYILQCSDGSFYTGKTVNLTKRLYEHDNGLFDNYTASRRPVVLKFQQEFPSAREAFRAERQIKGWTRAKKIALIKGDFELLKRLAAPRNPKYR